MNISCGTPATSKRAPQESVPKAGSPAYVDPAVCATCHHDLAETYRRTGMGRSFHRADSQKDSAQFRSPAKVYHRASDRYYTMAEHDGKFWERRHQIGWDGKETNLLEKPADYVIGSGNHAHTYLTRTQSGELKELPVSWYAEKGGYWAISPGYDRRDQDDFRRPIPYECMFCHNGYPAVKPGTDMAGSKPVFPANLPEGIDCQRCHGPGSAHVALLKSGHAKADEIRRAIVNPARLSRDRQMEVCMQCHLETSSRPLPYSIRRYDRGVFSYRPGEPLPDYALHFDQQPRPGADRFEIAGAAYRLRQSACFRQSQMTCLTCHNPHDIPRGSEAKQHYVSVCRTCHSNSVHVSKMSGASTSCLDCHMPKRRSQDAVHTIMTDHFIQRKKPAGNLLAELSEPDEEKDSYRGEVVPYYPAQVKGNDELYVAVAQVKDSANLEGGISRLQRALDKDKIGHPQPSTELGNAFAKLQQQEKGVAAYEQSLRVRKNYPPALKGLVAALFAEGKLDEVEGVIGDAKNAGQLDPVLLTNLGNAYLQRGKPASAEAPLAEAATLDPDLAETQNLLGLVGVAKGDAAGAESRFRKAIRIQPDLALAHHNLANLLGQTNRYSEAKYEFRKALAIDPNYIDAHRHYALLLEITSDFEGARSELETAVKLDPNQPEAHNDLADLLAAKGNPQRAADEYRAAIRLRPDFYEAHLGLATILARKGAATEAREHFEHAAMSTDPAVREPAMKALGH
ncbi:MAG: tetratricopeptide repeat protein [Bryobacteraceae bacterium]